LRRAPDQLQGSDDDHVVTGRDKYHEIVLWFFRNAQRNYLVGGRAADGRWQWRYFSADAECWVPRRAPSQSYHVLSRVSVPPEELKELRMREFPLTKRASTLLASALGMPATPAAADL